MLWAYAYKVGRKSGKGLWRPVKEATVIEKGPLKGVWKLTFFNGGTGLARAVQEKGE